MELFSEGVRRSGNDVIIPGKYEKQRTTRRDERSLLFACETNRKPGPTAKTQGAK